MSGTQNHDPQRWSCACGKSHSVSEELVYSFRLAVSSRRDWCRIHLASQNGSSVLVLLSFIARGAYHCDLSVSKGFRYYITSDGSSSGGYPMFALVLVLVQGVAVHGVV